MHAVASGLFEMHCTCTCVIVYTCSEAYSYEFHEIIIWLVIFEGPIFRVFSKISFHGCQLVNFFTLGYTVIASDTRLIVKNGAIDKDSGSSTGLKIIARALHGLLISFCLWVVGVKISWIKMHHEINENQYPTTMQYR